MSLFERFEPRSVAVFRALQLGDLLCAVPALRALRAACPRARITLVGLQWARSLPARYPRYLDDFIAFPGFPGMPEQVPDAAAFDGFVRRARARRFDLALQMHGDGRITNPIVRRLGARRSAGFGLGRAGASPAPGGRFLSYPDQGPEIRRLLALTRFLGTPDCGEQLEFPLYAADAAELRASGIDRSLEPGRYVCLHPGARAAERRWPVERFAALGEALFARYRLPLVVTGSQAESELSAELRNRMRAPSVDAATSISAGALAALLARSRLLVCNDTGVAHLAAALRLPSIVLFRASDPARWASLDSRLHRSVRACGGDGLDEVLGHVRALLS